MDTLHKTSKIALALVVAIGLSACSTEEDPPAANVAPTLSIESNISAVEGEPLVIPFTVSDNDHELDELRVILSTNGTLGDASVDFAAREIIYTGPWVTEGDQLTDGFAISVIDPAGGRVNVDISVLVNDIDSPVKLTVQTPAQAYGFQNTKTEDEVEFLYPEKTSLKIRFGIEELDADTLVSDFSISPEGVIFKNQVSVEYSEDGSEIVFTLPATDIAAASEEFSLTFAVDDGDALVTSVANVILVNEVALNWATGTPSEISESSGATLNYVSSEGFSYNASYDLVITQPNGQPLGFPVNYNLSSTSGEVIVLPSEGFQGDQAALITLDVSNIITNSAGEEFLEKTTLTRQVTFVDDRDDDFNIRLNGFFSNVSLLEDLEFRRDEGRVAKVVFDYLFFNGFIDNSTKLELVDGVKEILDLELNTLSTVAADIASRIDSGETGETLENDIASFSDSLLSAGSESRRFISEQVADIASTNADKNLPLGGLSTTASATVFEDRLTHFVGNGVYGFFADENKTDWRFREQYAYLYVADISDPFCF